MEWAGSQCKPNAKKLRMNMIDSNGTVKFIWKTVIMQSNPCSEPLIHTSENLLTTLGAEY